ncbi:hypothetical protein [Dokdonella fugitiva]|jgi:hypothetical protein|uniref:Uncharacterized protein n=1 Tax=Dokdonella fugitiva TaxID=328517 RepID=A0A4R2IHL5_9GAMM|nr:hypothetical protein [Dokdonella fugitiva]MBA8882715.1 glucan phosphoethanolaminetransferase (alkaline phosphatase superfamily) [Dokdonella fugitiva]TCO43309.1 hypothetical protein EV148_101732 [Dokdonella fugitiva]
MTIDSSVLLMVVLMLPLLFTAMTAATFWRRVSRPIVFTIFCFAAFYALQGIGYSIAFHYTGKLDVVTNAMAQARASNLSYAIGDVASLIIGVGLAYLLARSMPRQANA